MVDSELFHTEIVRGTEMSGYEEFYKKIEKTVETWKQRASSAQLFRGSRNRRRIFLKNFWRH